MYCQSAGDSLSSTRWQCRWRWWAVRSPSNDASRRWSDLFHSLQKRRKIDGDDEMRYLTQHINNHMSTIFFFLLRCSFACFHRKKTSRYRFLLVLSFYFFSPLIKMGKRPFYWVFRLHRPDGKDDEEEEEEKEEKSSLKWHENIFHFFRSQRKQLSSYANKKELVDPRKRGRRRCFSFWSFSESVIDSVKLLDFWHERSVWVSMRVDVCPV